MIQDAPLPFGPERPPARALSWAARGLPYPGRTFRHAGRGGRAVPRGGHAPSQGQCGVRKCKKRPTRWPRGAPRGRRGAPWKSPGTSKVLRGRGALLASSGRLWLCGGVREASPNPLPPPLPKSALLPIYEVDEPSACGKTQTHGAFANVRQHSSRKRHGFRSVLEGTWHSLRTPTTLNDDPEDHRRLTFATAVSQDDLEDMERHAFTTADGVEHHYFRRETSPRATSPRAAQHWGHARAAGRLTGLAGRTRRAATLG